MTLYRVEQVLEKGDEVVACSDIARGIMIISESSLFTLSCLIRNSQRVFELILQQVRALNRDQQRSFFALRNSFKELFSFEEIVKINAMPLSINASSDEIFPNCSRFNHSCCSNASYSWCNKLELERIFAVKDIKEEEEISVSYLFVQFEMTSESERRRHLLNEFEFQCYCDICFQNIEDASASDTRRRKLSQLNVAIGDGILIVTNSGRALKSCKDVLQLLKEEKESDVTVYVAYYDAFQMCVAHGDFGRASAMAGLAAKAKSDCQGNDADGIEKIGRFIQSSQTHRLAGITNKWRSIVEHARSSKSEGFEEWLWRKAEWCGISMFMQISWSWVA